MNVVIILLALVAGCFAGDASYKPEAQRGLLVLPKQGPTIASSTPTPQSDFSNNYKEQQQTPEILSPEFAARRGVYFVEVPRERIQALQARYQQASYQNNQNSQDVIVSKALTEDNEDAPSGDNLHRKADAPAQYIQQPVSQVNVRYLPLEASPSQNQFASTGFGSQYRAEQIDSQPVVRYLPIQLGEDNSKPAGYSSQYRQQQQQAEPTGYSSQYRQQQQQGESTDYNSQYRQQQGEPTGYLASVQYSEVEPIQGPVYSYKPEPLTRILRYAPVY